MQKWPDGIEHLAALRGDATAKTPADMSTYTAGISACGESWMAALQGDATARSPANVCTYTTVIRHAKGVGYHRGPGNSLTRCHGKGSNRHGHPHGVMIACGKRAMA